MKNNVDLTMDQIFHRDIFNNDMADPFMKPFFKLFTDKKVFPWDSVKFGFSLEPLEELTDDLKIVNSDEDFKVPLIVTGNAEKRKNAELTRRYEDLKICTYCNKRYFKWPWSNEPNCSCYDSESNVKEFPWNKDITIREMSVFR